MNLLAFLVVATAINLSSQTDDDREIPVEYPPHNRHRDPNVHWESWVSPEGMLWYPGRVDYRRRHKTDTFRQPAGVGVTRGPSDRRHHQTTRRYYSIEEGPQFLSEYKQQNAAQTNHETGDERQYPYAQHVPETGRGLYPHRGHHRYQTEGRDQYRTGGNRRFPGKVHYGEYFLNGQRVPNYGNQRQPNENGHFVPEQVNPYDQSQFVPGQDGQYISGRDDSHYAHRHHSQYGQGQIGAGQYEVVPDGQYIQPYYANLPNGEATGEQEGQYINVPDEYYPDGQDQYYYGGEGDYVQPSVDRGHHQFEQTVGNQDRYVPVGHPYGQDAFYEKRISLGESHVPRHHHYDHYPAGAHGGDSVRPVNPSNNGMIFAGRDALPVPDRDETNTAIEIQHVTPASSAVRDETNQYGLQTEHETDSRRTWIPLNVNHEEYDQIKQVMTTVAPSEPPTPRYEIRTRAPVAITIDHREVPHTTTQAPVMFETVTVPTSAPSTSKTTTVYTSEPKIQPSIQPSRSQQHTTLDANPTDTHIGNGERVDTGGREDHIYHHHRMIVNEPLATVPTVEIEVSMFQPDISEQEQFLRQIRHGQQHLRPEDRRDRVQQKGHDRQSITEHQRRTQHGIVTPAQDNVGGARLRSTEGSASVDRRRFHYTRRPTAEGLDESSREVNPDSRYPPHRTSDGGHTGSHSQQYPERRGLHIQQRLEPALRVDEGTSAEHRTGIQDGQEQQNRRQQPSSRQISRRYEDTNHRTPSERRRQLLPNRISPVDQQQPDNTQDRRTQYGSSSEAGYEEYGAVKNRKHARRRQQVTQRGSNSRRTHTPRRQSQQTRNSNNRKGLPGIAQRNSCPSLSQCRCCRWSTQQTQQAMECLQPKYKEVEVQVCIEESNGVCIRTGKKITLKPNGTEMKMCSKIQLKRSCHVCCPNHFPVGNSTTCTGVLDGIDKTGLRISIAADEGALEYSRLPQAVPQQRRRHPQRSRERSNHGQRTQYQSQNMRRRTGNNSRNVSRSTTVEDSNRQRDTNGGAISSRDCTPTSRQAGQGQRCIPNSGQQRTTSSNCCLTQEQFRNLVMRYCCNSKRYSGGVYSRRQCCVTPSTPANRSQVEERPRARVQPQPRQQPRSEHPPRFEPHRLSPDSYERLSEHSNGESSPPTQSRWIAQTRSASRSLRSSEIRRRQVVVSHQTSRDTGTTNMCCLNKNYLHRVICCIKRSLYQGCCKQIATRS